MIEQMTDLKYKPESVSPPGYTLQDILEDRGMTQAEFAARIGHTVKMVNEIIKGKAPIIPETAIQFERVLGVSAEFWNKREVIYRTYIAKKKEETSLKRKGRSQWLKQFPIKEMLQRKLLFVENDEESSLIIALLNFFGVATPEQWECGWTKRKLAFRQAMKLKNNVGSISAWLREGELAGEKIPCSFYDKAVLEKLINQIRALTLQTNPKVFIPELIKICADCGVAVVFIKPYPKVTVFGASYWMTPQKALIQLSLRGKTADQLWFTFFHELAHIIHHSKKEIFVDLDDSMEKKSETEEQADSLASEWLIPKQSLSHWLSNIKHINASSIVEFARELGVAPGIVVGRLQYIKRIKFNEFNSLKQRYQWDEN